MPLKVLLSKLCADNYDTEYNVVKNVNEHELMILSSGILWDIWDSDRLQKFSDSEEVPSWHGGFVKVECKEGVHIAVWADPTKPELVRALPHVPPAHETAVSTIPAAEPVHDVLMKSAGNFRRALQDMKIS